MLGQRNVVQTTPGTDGNLGYNYIAKDDDVWVYTGVTSATADNSIVGFVLINQRTAESHFYSVSGATEDSAMQSAEGQVPVSSTHLDVYKRQRVPLLFPGRRSPADLPDRPPPCEEVFPDEGFRLGWAVPGPLGRAFACALPEPFGFVRASAPVRAPLPLAAGLRPLPPPSPWGLSRHFGP